MRKTIILFFSLLLSVTLQAQVLKDSIHWNTPYYTIIYSEVLEQPKAIWYNVACPNGTASRTGMDFHTEPGIKTSDNADYINNEWDKGHMAPAAHFTDSKENLKQTFTYLNSTLQHEKLNRGEWRLLEAQERVWADTEVLEVYIRAIFSGKSQKLPSGAVVPDGFYKEIRFTKSGKVMCFYFPNQPPTKKWPEYQQKCK